MRFLAVGLMLMLAALVGAPSNAIAQGGKVVVSDADETIRKRGYQLFLEKKYVDALQEHLKVYKSQPKYCRNLYNLAQTFVQLGHNKEAYLFYSKTQQAWAQAGANCGWTLKDRQFNRINTMRASLGADLKTREFKKRIIDVGAFADANVDYSSKCSVTNLQDVGGKAIQFPDSIDLPAAWWFKNGEHRLELLCDGQTKEVVVSVGRPEAPVVACPSGGGASGPHTFWDDPGNWAVIAGVAGAGLTSGGIIFKWRARDKEKDALAIYDGKTAGAHSMAAENAARYKLQNDYNTAIYPDDRTGNWMLGAGVVLLATGTGLLVYDLIADGSGSATATTPGGYQYENQFKFSPTYDVESSSMGLLIDFGF